MRECFMYGSVRGAAGNGGPYRDPRCSPPVLRSDAIQAPRPAFRRSSVIVVSATF
jgi:hypothetical protein